MIAFALGVTGSGMGGTQAQILTPNPPKLVGPGGCGVGGWGAWARGALGSRVPQHRNLKMIALIMTNTHMWGF